MPKTKSKKLTWEEKISKQLVGRKIVEVRWMTKEEADESYWDYQPVLLILDDGTALCPMSDDEGNNAGVFLWINPNEHTTHPQFPNQKFVKTEVIPVI